MNKDLISIIIPIYNVEKFLPYSLERIINQSYNNIEIILVNDGSTDNSKIICQEYEKRDKRIKLINQKNQGAASARNTGIHNARGEYIGFMDPDDAISLQFYECLYKLIKDTNADITECATVQISESEFFNNKYKFDEIDDLEYETVNKKGALHRIHNEEIYIVGKSLVVWNKLYKKELWDKVRFPEGKRYEDDATTYKIFYQINKLVSTEKILHNYVQRENSAMHQEFSENRLEALDVFDEHVKFFSKLEDKYLFCKCLVRYLRIICTILEEVLNSSYKEKSKVKQKLQDKLQEIYKIVNMNINELKVDEYEYIRRNREIYYKEFYKLQGGIKK